MQKQDDPYPFAVTFIDPLFAVILHLGFAEGIFSTDWFQAWRPPTGSERFCIAVFALGFINIILAWLGYHQSIRRKPLRGLARFGIDVCLVMIYAAILVKFKNFGAVLWMLVAAYSLYVLWDFAKVLEYREEYKGAGAFANRYGREFVTTFWCALFITLAILHNYGVSDRVVLTCAFAATVGHRVNKVVPFWSGLGRGLQKILIR